MPNRLDSISPGLSALFQDAGKERQRRAVLGACSKAISDNALIDKEVQAAITLLKTGESGPQQARAELDALSQRFDETYFELSDEDDPSKPEPVPYFLKARATAALAFALSGNPADWCEALYEAISATDDRQGIMQIAEDELKAG